MGGALDQLEENVDRIQRNLYIPTCDESTIAYYEKLFGITYRFGDTMDFRR